MEDSVVRLAYESSVRAISDQAGVLEGLRSRAGTMFAAAAVVTSFFGSEALGGSTTDFEVWSLPGLASAFFVGTAFFTIVILWPLNFWFSLSAAEILAIADERPPESPVTASEAYRELALTLESNYDHNLPRVRALIWCFRLAILCLVTEVAIWIAILWRM